MVDITQSQLQPRVRYTDINGNPLAGGRVFAYEVNTSIPKTTYSDPQGLIPNTFPIILDSVGQANIFGSGLYTLIVFDANNVQIDSINGSFGLDTSIVANLASSGGSSGIGFIQSGIGAVPKTLQDKTREVISASDFGAAGDGVTNDTPSFAKLETAFTGRWVSLLGKTYIVDSIPNLNKYYDGGFNVGGTVTLTIYDTLPAQINYVDGASISRDIALAASVAENTLAITGIAGGAKAYQTLALLNASGAPTPVTTLCYVTNDGTSANNGMYGWNGSSWVKSVYDPLTQSKAYTDSSVGALSTMQISKNLYNPSSVQANKNIDSGTGYITTATSWSISGFIPVIAGQSYTLKCNATRRVGAAFYSDATGSNASYIAGSKDFTGGVANVAQTFVAPVGAAYLVIQVSSNVIPAPSQIQIELGAVATTYEAYYAPYPIVKDAALSQNVVLKAGLPALTVKPYEVKITSKNLFNKLTVVDGSYIDNSGTIYAAAGWGRSDYIPVVAGQTYTLSGNRSRIGVAFYTSNVATTAIGGSYNGGNLPLTLVAPVGATHLILNLYPSGTPLFDTVQVELGSSITSYEPLSGLITYVDSAFLTSTPKNTVVFSANTAIVNSFINGLPMSMSVLMTKPLSHDISSVLNFAQDTYNGVSLRSMNDDVAPLRALGTTIGANHGYVKTLITLTAHGKTDADVGSVWTDGTKQWVIVDIVSVNTLNITSRSDNTGFTVATLTHVSGAVHTTSMTPTLATTTSWFTVFKNRILTCSVDGKPVTIADGKFEYTNNVTFNESYDIMSKTDIVEWLILNGGVAVMQYLADASISVSISYAFDVDGGCVTTTDFLALKAVAAFQDAMMQQAVIMNSGNGTVKYIVPKSKSFVQDSVTYDFSYPVDIVAANPVNTLAFNAAKNAVGATPVNRVIQLNNQVAFSIGYLPILSAEPTARLTNASNKYLEIRNGTFKCYPSLIDTASKTSLAAGDYYSAVCYRKYSPVVAARTSAIPIRHKLGDYLIVDWQTAITDSVRLPPDFCGRGFTVFEKSANVNVLSQTATNRIVFQVTSSTPAYAVLKFN